MVQVSLSQQARDRLDWYGEGVMTRGAEMVAQAIQARLRKPRDQPKPDPLDHNTTPPGVRRNAYEMGLRREP